MKTIDPVTLAVLKGRLEQIADEMDATLYRSAFNPIIAEARDACHGLYHAETGATLVQGTTGLPIFVGAMAFAVKAVIDKVARDALGPRSTRGRATPSCSTTPMTAARISTISGWCGRSIANGKVFCWIASVGHWLDIGGNVPGGFNARATESYQEGVRIPPVKLIREGRLNEDIVDILSANSRVRALQLWRSQRPAQRARARRTAARPNCSTPMATRRSSSAFDGVHAPRRGADAREPRAPCPTASTVSRIFSTMTASPTCR